MATTKRVVGDTGPGARLYAALEDIEGDPVVDGDVTVRAGGLFDGAMTYQGAGVVGGASFDDGVWFYDPQPGDLTAPGMYLLEFNDGSVTLPSDRPHELHVRARVPAPPEE